MTQKINNMFRVSLMSRVFLFLLFSGCLFGHAVPSNAAGIGVSPSSINTEILAGDKVEQTLSLSRFGNSEEMRFLVQVSEGNDFIDLLGQEEVIIPFGASQISFTFAINAQNLGVGEKIGNIQFLSDMQMQDGNSGNLVQTGLEVKVKASIVNAYAVDETVDAQQNCSILSEIAVSNMRLSYARGGGGDTLDLTWDMQNIGSVSMKSVAYETNIFRDGVLISSSREVAGGVFEAGQTISQIKSQHFSSLLPGLYRVELKWGDKTQTVQITVEPTLWQAIWDQVSIISVAVGGLLAAVFAFLFIKTKLSLYATVRALGKMKRKVASAATSGAKKITRRRTTKFSAKREK